MPRPTPQASWMTGFISGSQLGGHIHERRSVFFAAGSVFPFGHTVRVSFHWLPGASSLSWEPGLPLRPCVADTFYIPYSSALSGTRFLFQSLLLLTTPQRWNSRFILLTDWGQEPRQWPPVHGPRWAALLLTGLALMLASPRTPSCGLQCDRSPSRSPTGAGKCLSVPLLPEQAPCLACGSPFSR